MGIERRRTLRFPFDAAVEVSIDAGKSHFPARMTEISLHGCFLQASEAVEVGATVFVKIYEPDFFEAHVTVLYAQPRSGMGVLFANMKPHFAGVLKKWLLAAMLATQKPAG
jgi:hypothetical protein